MIQRPPPPDLPTPTHSWRAVRRSTLVSFLAAGLLVYEAVFKSGPADPTLVVLYGVLLGVPGPVAANELLKRLLTDRDQR